MPNTLLDGSKAIVTGASRGFGLAVARELLHAGAHVVGVARSESALRDLREEHGDCFDFEVADAADPSLPDRLLVRHRPQIVLRDEGDRVPPQTGMPQITAGLGHSPPG